MFKHQYTVVHVRLGNAQAVKDLAYAARVLAEAAEDQPWKPEFKRAVKRLKRAVKGLRPRQDEKQP